MAEETENEKLLREIKALTELINSHSAKQTKAAKTKFTPGSRPYFCGMHHTTPHQPHQTGSKTTSFCSNLPQHQQSHYQTLNSVSRTSQPACSTQQCRHTCSEGTAPQTVQLDNHIKKLETFAQDLEKIKLKAALAHKTSKSAKEGSAYNEIRPQVEFQNSKKIAPQTKYPSSGHISSSITTSADSLPVSTLPPSASSSVRLLDMATHLDCSTSVAICTTTRQGGQGEHLQAPTGGTGSLSGNFPTSLTGLPASPSSSLKDQLVTRSAQVKASLDSVKSSLAKLEAAKRNKLNSRTVRCTGTNIDLSGLSKNSKEGFQGNKKEPHCVERTGSKDGNEMRELGPVKANTGRKDSYQASKKQTNISTLTSASSADTQLDKLKKNVVKTNCSTELKKVQNPSSHTNLTQDIKEDTSSLLLPACLQPKASQTGHISLSSSTKQDVTHQSNMALSRSPSKVADLKKELQATEEKLVGMRKKMGMMLKESPNKIHQLHNSVSRAGQHQKTDPVALLVAVVPPRSLHKDSHPAVSGSIPACRRRPIPNRKSLRWSPQKSLKSSSEESLVVRSSTNTRLPQKASKIDQQQTPISHSSFKRVRIGCLKGKKSPFSLVRIHTTPPQNTTPKNPTSKSITTSSLAQGKVDSQDSRHFVGRYKFQRICSNSSKGSVGVQNVPRKFSISHYKLVRTSSYSYVNPALCSTPQTASQRAAKVIKSKYKMRKVFVSPAVSSASGTSKQYLIKHQLARTTLRGSAQPYAWTKRPTKYIGRSYLYKPASRFSFQSQSSTFHCTAARKDRFSSRQKMGRNRSAYNRQSWSRQQTLSDTAPWWMWQYAKKNSLHQQTWRRKMKATSVWHRQQRLNALAVCYPSTQWHYKTHRTRKEQLHKKLLLKRLQWMQKYNMARRQLSQRESSPTKSRPQKQARLVMINGILYKSSSRRLTKASPTSASTSTTTTTHTTNTTSGVIPTASQSKFSSAVVVRNMKQHKMQTVTVRGVSFKMDSRGTKLQRVLSHTQQDKSTAVSRVDIGGTTYVQTKEGVLEKISDSQTRIVVNRVKQRSIARAAAKFRKDNTERRKVKACLFYSRFGKCSRGNDCPYLHDPDKIAVCTRFLRGTCKAEKCLFSHKVSKEKMPVCAFFLRGVCTREQCPYLHVKVTHGADICKDFVNGFCPLADKCQKLHTLTCPHFAKTGVCPDGRKCRLLHKKFTRRDRRRTLSGPTQQNSLSGSSIKRKATAIEVEEQDFQQVHEYSTLPSKRFKPNLNMDFESQAPNSSFSAQEVAEAPTMPAEAAFLLQSDSQTDAGYDYAERAEKRRVVLEPKSAKLPAFISLAHYTVEDSPAVRRSDSRCRKISFKMTGTPLQIKPRI